MKIKYSKKNKSGFTLIEITVVISIFLFIMIISSDFIISSLKTIRYESEQETAVRNARKAMDIMTKEIREAQNSARGDYVIATATAQNFVYYCDGDNNGSVERINYFLQGSTLKKTQTEPGTASDYTGTSTTIDLADYVNNQTEPIFSYHNAGYATTSEISQIRLVNIKLKINVTPAIAPQDYYVETDIHLRNLKDNL